MPLGRSMQRNAGERAGNWRHGRAARSALARTLLVSSSVRMRLQCRRAEGRVTLYCLCAC